MNKKTSPSLLLWSLLDSERKEFGIIILYGIGVSLTALAIPVGVQTLVNTVMLGSISQPFVFLLIAVFAGLTIGSVLRAFQIRIVELFQRRFFCQIALEIAYRIPRFRFDSRDQHRFPELVNRFFDVLTVQKSSANLLLEGFGLGMQVAIGLVLLTTYHWFLFAYACGLIVCICMILSLMGKGAVATSIEESVHKYRVAAWLEDIAGKPYMFRSAAARSMALTRADEIVSGYLEAREAHFRILFRQVIGFLALQTIASIVLLGIGAWLVVQNQLSLGQLVAAEIIVTGALASLAKFQKHLESYYDLIAALDKVEGLLAVPLEKSKGIESMSALASASVDIANVNFSYNGRKSALDRLNLSVEARGRLAVVGSNGSGKSTLMDLIYGVRSPSDGSILLGGIDIRDMDMDFLRQHVALVREREVIADTILGNVALGRAEVDANDVRKALKAVGLLDDILKLTDGLATKLDGQGGPLSVSQVNALGIARAIAGRPLLILIDGTLDTLDEKTCVAAVAALLDPQAPWTVIVATHSMAIAEVFPKVVSLDHVELQKGGNAIAR